MALLNMKVDNPTKIWSGQLYQSNYRLLMVPAKRDSDKSNFILEKESTDTLDDPCWIKVQLEVNILEHMLFRMYVSSQEKIQELEDELRLIQEG